MIHFMTCNYSFSSFLRKIIVKKIWNQIFVDVIFKNKLCLKVDLPNKSIFDEFVSDLFLVEILQHFRRKKILFSTSFLFFAMFLGSEKCQISINTPA